MIFCHPCRPSSEKKSPFAHLALIIILSVGSIGCQQFTLQSDFMNLLRKKTQGEFHLSPSELRAYLNDISDTFAGMIEDGADDIIAGANDPKVRKQALLWKANAIPIVHDTLFHSDPLVAIIDTKAFILQMIQYFESGPGKSAFGPWHETALNVCRNMDDIINDIGILLAGEEKNREFRGDLVIWVKNHPITSPNFYRASLTAELASIIGEQSVDTFKAMGNLALGMNDIAARLNVYSKHLPKQARWQAELFLSDELPPDSARIVLGELMVMTDAARRITGVVETSPDLVAKEREIILEKVEAERVQVIGTLQAEHELARNWLSGERNIILDAVEDQVRVVERALREMIAEERKAVLSEAETMRERLIIDAVDYTEQMINRLLLKLGLVCLGGLLGAFMLLWVFGRNRWTRSAR